MRLVHLAVLGACAVSARCLPARDVELPEVSGAGSVLLLELGPDGASALALDLPAHEAITLAGASELEALYYPCRLDALRIPAGRVALVEREGRALPLPMARRARRLEDASWSTLPLEPSARVAALQLALEPESTCTRFEERRTIWVPAPEGFDRETPTGAVLLDDGRVLITTSALRAFVASPDEAEVRPVPGLSRGRIVYEHAARRAGDPRLWLLGNHLDLYVARDRGGGDFVVTTTLAPAQAAAVGRSWLAVAPRGPAVAWALGADGTLTRYPEVGAVASFPCADCGEIDNAGGVAVTPDGDAWAARAAHAIHVRGEVAEPLDLALDGGGQLTTVVDSGALGLGVLFGASGGRVYAEQAGEWGTLVVTLGPPVRVIVPLEESVLFGGEIGELREHQRSGEVCPPVQVGPADVRLALVAPSGLVLIGHQDRGASFVRFVSMSRTPAACPRAP